MKRFVNVMAFLLLIAGTTCLPAGTKAQVLPNGRQVRDAFDGILPVTDPQMKRSLNGEWQLIPERAACTIWSTVRSPKAGRNRRVKT